MDDADVDAMLAAMPGSTTMAVGTVRVPILFDDADLATVDAAGAPALARATTALCRLSAVPAIRPQSTTVVIDTITYRVLDVQREDDGVLGRLTLQHLVR